MRKMLEKLIELQDIDTKLQLLEEARGDFPQRVEEISQEVYATENDLVVKKQMLDEQTSRMHAVDGEVVMLKEKLKKYQNQLYQVKTNKEYDAITLEIETTKEKIDELEFEFLELEESTQTVDKEIEELDRLLGEKREQLGHVKSQLQDMLDETRESEDSLTKIKKDLQGHLTPQIFSTYERTRLGRGGQAVASLLNGSCSECSSKIPPQRSLEIRMMDTMFRCEVCGRILVWQPEKEKVN